MKTALACLLLLIFFGVATWAAYKIHFEMEPVATNKEK